MQEVKATTIFYRKIKHSSYPSLCIGENDGTILEFKLDIGGRL